MSVDNLYIENQLKKNLGSEMYDLLRSCNAMIIGGALTSILSRKEINDYDCYFRCKEDVGKFLLSVGNNDEYAWACRFLCSTDKSITFSFGDKKIQLIHQSYYEDIPDVFKDFDFTINMIGYDLNYFQLVCHKDSMQHLAQRILVVNPETKFPLISVLRVNKYLDRDYTISKKEMFKLLLSVNRIEMNSYEDVIKQLGGLYGESIDKVFNKDADFCLTNVIDQLSKYDFDNFTPYEPQDFYELRNDFVFKDHVDLLLTLPFYKGVKIIDNKFVSDWDNDFEYTLGEFATPSYKVREYNKGIYGCHKPKDCYRGDVLISLMGSFDNYDGYRFEDGVMVGHCVSYDKDSEKSMGEVLDYLLDLGYIKPQDKRVVELYYGSNDFDLKRYVNK